MKKIMYAIIFCLALIPFAVAGIIEEPECIEWEQQCSEYEDVCVDWDTQCTKWVGPPHARFCVKWGDVCTEYESQCVSYEDVCVAYETDDPEEPEEPAQKIVYRGGGMSSESLWKELTGIRNIPNKPFISILDDRFLSLNRYNTEIKKINDRLDIIEQFLIDRFEFNPDDTRLQRGASVRLGRAVGNTLCKDGLCVTTQ